MKIYINQTELRGSPAEIVKLMREASFSKEQFTSAADYSKYLARRISELADRKVEITKGADDETASREILLALESIGALEIEEDEA